MPKVKVKSVPIKVSVSNERIDEKTPSVYNRLVRYAKEKGFKQQDCIRFFITNGLEKAGY